jgi:hypothetical protein
VAREIRGIPPQAPGAFPEWPNPDDYIAPEPPAAPAPAVGMGLRVLREVVREALGVDEAEMIRRERAALARLTAPPVPPGLVSQEEFQMVLGALYQMQHALNVMAGGGAVSPMPPEPNVGIDRVDRNEQPPLTDHPGQLRIEDLEAEEARKAAAANPPRPQQQQGPKKGR